MVDFFADTDTRSIAHATRKITGHIRRGFTWAALERALLALDKEAPSPIMGFVYGAGFEDRPHLLTPIGERWPLFGNDAATLKRLKAPETFFAGLAQLGIPHPKTRTTPPPSLAGWLMKRRGGAGGSHVRPASKTARDDGYYQEIVPGRAVSALFVGDGERATALGFSEQWTAPKRNAPFRYGGAVRPALLPSRIEEAMASIVTQVTAAFAIRGLASADFMVCDEDAVLLEINPRPGATLDIFDSDEMPLLQLHLDAMVKPGLPDVPLKLTGAAASGIVYAPETVTIGKEVIWPRWAMDRPQPGDRIDKDRPICTVAARAQTLKGAKNHIEARISAILAALHGRSGGKINEQKDGRKHAPHGLAERQHPRRAARSKAHR